MKKSDCVQCGEEMKYAYGNESWSAPFCSNKECPNYHILQVGIIPEEDLKISKG